MSHFEVIDGVRHYDQMKTWHFLFRQGRMKFGKNFQIEKQDIPVIRQLIVHAIQEHDLSKKYGLDLNKGILLTGPVGCGKTSWMHLMQCLMEPGQKFLVKSSRDIAFEFNKEGYDVINNYGKRHRPICLDDIGVEQNIKFYGNECNTIAEVLLHRYDLQVNHGIITYATTNLSASQLEQLYGNRVRSRLRSMFNLIAFPETSTDKRR